MRRLAIELISNYNIDKIVELIRILNEEIDDIDFSMTMSQYFDEHLDYIDDFGK